MQHTNINLSGCSSRGDLPAPHALDPAGMSCCQKLALIEVLAAPSDMRCQLHAVQQSLFYVACWT